MKFKLNMKKGGSIKTLIVILAIVILAAPLINYSINYLANENIFQNLLKSPLEGSIILESGTGFSGDTPQPDPIGITQGYDENAIARWDVVPYQDVAGSDFNVGVVAFHMNGIERVDFSVNGGPWASVSSMSLNSQTGVNEYVATLRPANLPSGLIEVRSIAYPVVGTPRVLEPLYLHVVHDPSADPQIWIDSVNGNDVSAVVNDRAHPTATFGRAIQIIADYNEARGLGRVVDGGKIFLMAGHYAPGPSSTSEPSYADTVNLNNQRWLEITRDPQTPKSSVIIDKKGGPSLYRTKWNDITIYIPQESTYGLFITGGKPAGGLGGYIWLSNSDVSTYSRYDGNAYPFVNAWEGTYQTDNYFHEMPYGEPAIISRNNRFDHITADVLTGTQMAINIQISDLSRIGTPAHTDVHQFLGDTGDELSNVIDYGITATDRIAAQGIFAAGANLRDFAFINVQLSNADGAAMAAEAGEDFSDNIVQLNPPSRHVIFKDSSFVGSANLREGAFTAKNVVVDHVYIPWSPDGRFGGVTEGVIYKNVPVSPPGIPQNFIASKSSPTEALLSWTDLSNEDYYVIERSTQSSVGYEIVSQPFAGTITITDAGLTTGTTYYYKIKAVNLGGESSYSPVVSITPKADTGLVGYWPFEEGSGTTTSDESDNENAGTLSDGSMWIDAKYGSGLNFDGNKHANMGIASALALSKFTVAGWVKSTGYQNNMAIFGKGNSGSINGFNYLCFNSVVATAVTCAVGNGVSNQWIGPVIVPANEWYHLAFSFDGNTFRIYVNGVLATSALKTLSGEGFSGSNGEFIVGASTNWYNGERFIGSIDEVRVYDRALPDSEVRNLYETVPSICSAGKKNSVTHHGITWTFDKCYQSGQFITGDYWVVGPATVLNVSPGWDGVRHGSMVNPDPGLKYQSMYAGEKQGYDSRAHGTYADDLRAKFPLTLQLDQSLVSTIGLQNSYGDGRSFIDEGAFLSVVSTTPPLDAFPPSYFASDGPKEIFRMSDINRGLLPNLKLPVGVSVDSEDVAKRLEGPRLGHLFVHGYQYITPVHSSGGHPGELVYSRDSSSLISNAMVATMLENPNEHLLISVIQRGLENYFILKRNPHLWPAGGGHSNGNKEIVVYNGLLFNNPDMISVAQEMSSNEDDQTYYYDDPQLPAEVRGVKGWTGATALWGQNGVEDNYEYKHPAQWTWDGRGLEGDPAAGQRSDVRSRSYNLCCTVWTQVGGALAIKLMHGENEWNHPPFFDYIDRWMSEVLTEAQLDELRAIDPTLGTVGGSTAGWSSSAFVSSMWEEYRPTLEPKGKGVVIYPAPVSPRNLAAGAAAFSPEIKLSWNDISYEKTFTLERSISASSGFTEIAVLPADTTYYRDGGLLGSTTYYYRLKASNNGGTSDYTSVVSATTQTLTAEGKTLGPVGRWSFEGDLSDSVGTVTGTLAGNGVFELGKSGQAIALDGGSGVNLGSPFLADWGITDQMTVSLWEKQGSISGFGGALFAKGIWGGNHGGTSFVIYISDGIVGVRISDGDESIYLGSGVPTPQNEWNHIVLTLNKGMVKLYQNGVQVGEASSPTFGNLNDPFYDRETGIGYVADHWAIPFSGEGRIDEARIYNRALSGQEILDLYQMKESVKINSAPSIKAGDDQLLTTLNLPIPAILDGSASDDGLPSGTLSYAWTTVSGPGTVTFADSSAVTTTATFGSFGTYVLRLTVTDGELSSSDDIQVVVAKTNTAPTVNAGSDKTITLPSSVSLLGTASDDGLPSGTLSYAWTTVSGPGTATFADPSASSATVTFNVEGNYVLRLTASDGQYDSSDTVNVIVNPTINQAPSVSVTSPTSSSTYNSPISLVITASASDSDGSISKVEFYDGISLLSSDILSPYSYSWSGVPVGVHTITAIATDDDGASKTSTAVSITVQNPTFLDTDNDGVNDLDGIDKCPNTSAGLSVNVHGCPVPRSSEFTKLTPDVKKTDLFAVPSPVIGNAYGEISFTGLTMNLLNDYSGSIVQPLDLDAGISIGQGKISLSPTLLPNLNKPAYLTFYNINKKQYSKLLVSRDLRAYDGYKIVSYNEITKVLVIWVSGFSTYEVIEVDAPTATDFNHLFPPLEEVTDLSKINNFEIGDTNYGTIKYTGDISLVADKLDGVDSVDLNSIVKIEKNRVSIDSARAPGLNSVAEVKMYSVAFSNPVILKDGTRCPSTECTDVTLENGVLTFKVQGFSTYEAVEESSLSVPTSTGSSGGSSGGGSLGGGSRFGTVTPSKALENYANEDASMGIPAESGSIVGTGAQPTDKEKLFGMVQVVLVGFALGLLIVIIALARRMSRQRVEN